MHLVFYVEMVESAVLVLALNKSKKIAKLFANKVMTVGELIVVVVLFSSFPLFVIMDSD